MRLDVVDGGAQVGEPRGAQAVVGRCDEVLYVRLVLLEVRVDVGLVDEAGALGLWEDEVEEEAEADVGVEGDPTGEGESLLAWGPLARGKGSLRAGMGGALTHQQRIHSVQDSTRSAQARTTQYMSHGVSSAGSEVLSAL